MGHGVLGKISQPPQCLALYPSRQVSRYSILIFFLLHKSYFLTLSKKSMSRTFLHLFIKVHKDVRPPQLIMHMVSRGTKTSEVVMWELGVIHLLDSRYTGLLLACVCIIIFIFLSQDSAAFIGRIGGYDTRWIEPKFQKDQVVMAWWWWWTHSSLIQAESTWNVASVETEEFVGRILSNAGFSGWCSLPQALQKWWSHSRDLGSLFLGIC